jgi:hypothetical protein
MEEEVILSVEQGSETFKQFLSQYDAPAYIRRARAVQLAWDQLVERCRRQRQEWLQMARLRIGLLYGLAGDWRNLAPLVQDEAQLVLLRRLHEELSPRLRSAVEPTPSPRALRQAGRELQESLERFNERWQTYLAAVDLTEVNELRDGYNRYYVLEKECAVRSARVARQGFSRLPPLTHEDLQARFPLLPLPSWSS